jgi:hypothetical protein
LPPVGIDAQFQKLQRAAFLRRDRTTIGTLRRIDLSLTRLEKPRARAAIASSGSA